MLLAQALVVHDEVQAHDRVGVGVAVGRRAQPDVGPADPALLQPLGDERVAVGPGVDEHQVEVVTPLSSVAPELSGSRDVGWVHKRLRTAGVVFTPNREIAQVEEEHVTHYGSLLDPLMTPLYLSEADKRALVAFMRTLTGSNVQRLAAQARAARLPCGPSMRVYWR